MSQDDVPRPSPVAQAAQERLLRIRAELGLVHRPADVPASVIEPPVTNWALVNAKRELARQRETLGIGAGTDAAQAAARRAWRCEWPTDAAEPTQDTPDAARGEEADEGAIPQPAAGAPEAAIVAHPTMLLAMLRQRREGAGRVWLLLRAIDREGRGRLDLSDVRRHLTDAGAPLRICGPRRLRQLLAQGEGLFWHRDAADRLWLAGGHRVAHALGCTRLQGAPIELPLSSLLGGIQAVRAAFYAAFHGGRDGRPISRRTLRTLSGVPDRTQLVYDRVAHVEARPNMAIGGRYTPEQIQERAWRQGRGVFRFIDKEGRQGRPGGQYVAWRMPNSYHVACQHHSRGSRRRINRKLAGLVVKGTPGNDDRAIEKLFFHDGATAARQYNRDPQRDAYWRPEAARERLPGHDLWYVIAGSGG